MVHRHKGFAIELLAEGSPTRFRYRIRLGDRPSVTSVASYASQEAAVRAARAFVEAVDRTMGLGALDSAP